MRDMVTWVSHRSHQSLKNGGAFREIRDLAEDKMLGREITYNDLTIQFIGASGLPKMDVVGSADPYFIADLDGHISIV